MLVRQTTSYHHAACQYESTWWKSPETKVTTSDVVRAKHTTDEFDCIFVYLFSAWPLPLTAVSLNVWGWHFTSVYLDSQAVVVVWIWITNPFLIPFRRCWVPVAMATVHHGFRKTPCEMEIVRLVSFVCPSLFHQFCSSWPITPVLLSTLYVVEDVLMCVRMEDLSARLSGSYFVFF